MEKHTTPCYFMAANAPGGFYSLFDRMYDPGSDWRCVILKGGPGSGKSTLMKKAARQAAAAGHPVELIYCSSDPRSLDGVILPTQHRCMADGTAPHVLEPVLPGACEVLFNPGDCWDRTQLFARRDEIRAAQASVQACHRRAAQLRSAAGAMLANARALAAPALDEKKLELYCKRLCRRLFRGVPAGDGTETLRFLSGITPDGWITFGHTLTCLADRVVLLEDDTGLAARQILSAVRDAARTHGCAVVVCCNPMAPEEPEAVILPHRREAFALTDRFRRFDFLPERVVHTQRFSDPRLRAAVRRRIRARLNTAAELLDETAEVLQQARAYHDVLESYYVAAMDFEKLNALGDALVEEWVR